MRDAEAVGTAAWTQPSITRKPPSPWPELLQRQKLHFGGERMNGQTDMASSALCGLQARGQIPLLAQ